MINLLPPEEKQALLAGKKQKLVTIYGLVVLIPLVCFILILLSIRFFILGETKSQQAILEQARKDYQTPDFLSFKDTIQKSNAALQLWQQSRGNRIETGQALETISDIPRPEGLYLTNLSIKKGEGGKMDVMVSGFSATREALLAFQKNIGSLETVSTVSFSPESWVKATNTSFSATFQLNP